MNRANGRRPDIRAAVRRIRRALAPLPRRQPETEPTDQWQRETDARLRAIEQKLGDQNRLLLLALVTMAGEFVYQTVAR